MVVFHQTVCSAKIETEVFLGKILRDLYEDELVSLCEKAGPIWDLCLMVEPSPVRTKNMHLSSSVERKLPTEQLNKLCKNYEICPGQHLGMCISVRTTDFLFNL